ncbi:MAG TPA: hypothetical protein VLM89_16655 [Phycisphaerae bacterium]|nr:hypothetical protein [Phycisphaerae bacterium]
MTHPEPPDDRPRARSASTRGRRATYTAIAILMLLWLVAIWYRWEIRAYWWAYRITAVESPELQSYYAGSLAAIGDRALPALPRLLDDPRESIRLIGVRILRSCPNLRALQCLFMRLGDPSVEVSDAAALEIALRPDRLQALPVLQEMAAGPSATAAMVALERIGGPQAEDILIERLSNADDPDVTAQAIDSLGMLGCRAAEPVIQGHLGDHRPLTCPPASQRRAERAIAAVQGKLLAQGIRPEDLAAVARTDLTIAAVAARALASLAPTPASHPTSRP